LHQRHRSVVIRTSRAPSTRTRSIGDAVGLFVSLRFPNGTDEVTLLRESRLRGVMIDGNNEHAALPQPPGVAFGFSGGPAPGLRIATKLFAEAARAG